VIAVFVVIDVCSSDCSDVYVFVVIAVTFVFAVIAVSNMFAVML